MKIYFDNMKAESLNYFKLATYFIKILFNNK